MKPTPAPQPNFDRIARPYRLLERVTFGRALERCRMHFLPRLGDRRAALVLGDGDGRFLAALLAACPQIEADAVDTSAEMLRLLRRRAEAATPGVERRLRTHQADALAFEPRKRYDLVVTHFFLDCLTQAELDLLCARVVPHLAPGALWLVSDFCIPRGLMRSPAYILVRSLYLGFRILTGLRTTALPDYASALAAHGFERSAFRVSRGEILISEIWQLHNYFRSDAGIYCPHVGP